MLKKSANGVSEIIISEDFLTVERLTTPGGFLYITRFLGLNGDVAVASTFVPDPMSIDQPF